MNIKIKILTTVLLVTIFIPQVAFAAWWNPFSWNIFSWIFNNQPAAVVETLNNEEIATSTNEIVATTTQETKDNVVKEPTVKRSPTPIPSNQQTAQKKPSISPDQLTASVGKVISTPTTTSQQKDDELKLLKEQNDILKQQLTAQQQIAQAITPVNGSCSTTLNICTNGIFGDVTDTSTHYLWSCKGSNGGSTASCSLSVPSFEFNPIVEVGGATGYGFLHPEFKEIGCLGCDLTDIGWAYVTIPEGPASGTFKMSYTNNTGSISTINSYFTNKKVVQIGSVPAGSVLVNWEVIANKTGYTSTTKTGSFVSRSPRLVAIPESEKSNGFIFMNYGVIEKGSTITATIKFQGSGQNVEVQYIRDGEYTYTVVPVVSDGDTLVLSGIAHHINIRSINGSDPWTNNLSVKFKIISATAVDADGKLIEFYY